MFLTYFRTRHVIHDSFPIFAQVRAELGIAPCRAERDAPPPVADGLVPAAVRGVLALHGHQFAVRDQPVGRGVWDIELLIYLNEDETQFTKYWHHPPEEEDEKVGEHIFLRRARPERFFLCTNDWDSCSYTHNEGAIAFVALQMKTANITILNNT